MFSVRQMPWHGLGVVLDEYPQSVDEALDKAGLGWSVKDGDVLITGGSGTPVIPASADIEQAADAIADVTEGLDEAQRFAVANAALRSYAANFRPAKLSDGALMKANIREDTGDLLGIVTSDYQVVENREAFSFLDELIGSELHFETAGSLQGGRRVWALARLPEFVEVGGDQTGTFVFVANSHDGSMSVTAAVTPVRIVCANTLGMALRQTDHGAQAQRTFRFRHTGDLRGRVYEARRVMELAVSYGARFKELGDRLAQERMTRGQFERKVLNRLFVVDDDTTQRARTFRTNAKDTILANFAGRGEHGDTRGNAPGTKWTAFNAVAEYADHGRRVTQRTNQMARSFEDNNLKQRALDLVTAA